jgi:flagellar protein FliS
VAVQLNAYDQYRKTKVGTSSRAGLVIMLYDGILRFTRQAVKSVERAEFEEAHRNFVRAQDIMAELQGSLNLEVGGDLARNLHGLYEYGYRRLVEANCQKATPPALEVITLFHDLLEAWKQIVDRYPDDASASRELVMVAR